MRVKQYHLITKLRANMSSPTALIDLHNAKYWRYFLRWYDIISLISKRKSPVSSCRSRLSYFHRWGIILQLSLAWPLSKMEFKQKVFYLIQINYKLSNQKTFNQIREACIETYKQANQASSLSPLRNFDSIANHTVQQSMSRRKLIWIFTLCTYLKTPFFHSALQYFLSSWRNIR